MKIGAGLEMKRIGENQVFSFTRKGQGIEIGRVYAFDSIDFCPSETATFSDKELIVIAKAMQKIKARRFGGVRK